MKTLDEIINRQDYVRMNSALIARAHELAVIIRDKMLQIDMKESQAVPCVALKEIFRVSNGNRFSCGMSICYRVLISDPEDRYYNILSGGDQFSYYSIDERTSWDESVNREADSKMLLYFLNNVRNILNEIDALESKKVAEMKKAIAETSNIK